jgi:hypothetical protein
MAGGLGACVCVRNRYVHAILFLEPVFIAASTLKGMEHNRSMPMNLLQG